MIPRAGRRSSRSRFPTAALVPGLLYQEELIGPAELPARLAHYRTQTDTPRVIVTGDERAKFGPMVAVLDVIRQAGIAQFSVETRPRPTGR